MDNTPLTLKISYINEEEFPKEKQNYNESRFNI